MSLVTKRRLGPTRCRTALVCLQYIYVDYQSGQRLLSVWVLISGLGWKKRRLPDICSASLDWWSMCWLSCFFSHVFNEQEGKRLFQSAVASYSKIYPSQAEAVLRMHWFKAVKSSPRAAFVFEQQAQRQSFHTNVKMFLGLRVSQSTWRLELLLSPAHHFLEAETTKKVVKLVVLGKVRVYRLSSGLN